MKDAHNHKVREKSRERRRQVLDAAAKCFREVGFHGCSIARISKAADMSPGHIYYHFMNKEAIVEALVARQENSLFELLNNISTSPIDEDFVDTLTRQTEKMVAFHSDPDFVGLWLEIATEATRNSSIARLLALSEKTICTKLDEQLALRRKDANDEELLQLRINMRIIAAIFSGLSVRTSMQTPENQVDNALLVEKINYIITCIFARK